MTCNSPARFTLDGYCDTAAVFWFLHLAPRWNHVWRRSQKCLFQCFFNRAHPSLSAITVGRGVEVACNDDCIIFHCDFPELAQQLLGNVAPLRCRVAQLRRDGCVRTVSLLRRSPEPCLKQEVFQAEGVLHRRALDFFVDLHTLGFKGALVI